MNGFPVANKQCSSCIYRPNSPLDIEKLEQEIKDIHLGFKTWRVCHHSFEKRPVCCRGFWNRHSDEFQVGQIAKRLGLVEFEQIDDDQE
jgi:hypothetical protein